MKAVWKEMDEKNIDKVTRISLVFEYQKKMLAFSLAFSTRIWFNFCGIQCNQNSFIFCKMFRYEVLYNSVIPKDCQFL